MSRAADFVPGYVHPEPREGALYASSAAIIRAWWDEGRLLPELVERLAPDAQAFARDLLGAPAPVLAPHVTVGRAVEPTLRVSLPAAGAMAAAWVTGCLRRRIPAEHRLTALDERAYLWSLRQAVPPPGSRPRCWRIALQMWLDGDRANLLSLARQESTAAVAWVEALLGHAAPPVELVEFLIPAPSIPTPLSDYERQTLARQAAMGSTSTLGLTDRPHLVEYLGQCAAIYRSVWDAVAEPGPCAPPAPKPVLCAPPAPDRAAPIGDTVRPVTLSPVPDSTDRPRLLFGARIPSSVREVRLDGRAVALERVWELAVGLIPGAVWVRLVDTDRCWVSGIEVHWLDGGVRRSVNPPAGGAPVRTESLNKPGDSLNESAGERRQLALL